MDGQLIGGHQDGRVGDLAEQLNTEAAIEAEATLGAVDGHQAGPELSVAGPLFAKTRSSNFCKKKRTVMAKNDSQQKLLE